MTSKKKIEKEKEEKTCVGVTHDGIFCGRKLYDDEHCIFHSKDIEGKEDKFNDEFWKEFKRQDVWCQVNNFPFKFEMMYRTRENHTTVNRVRQLAAKMKIPIRCTY